ncbi:SDR family NAD(P)-dependent oxidoreductase [Paraburkholderia sediminicola]|uniref:SDR family NAD(P)-dependent oxidoreductase n=2 Tax=Paraburkholderia TaxID=1822464 RepID=UPI0038B9B9C5
MTDFVYFWVATFINVSWVAGHNVRPGSAVYATTRAAVRMLSEGQRQEAKPYNIRTTIVSPGALADQRQGLRAQIDGQLVIARTAHVDNGLDDFQTVEFAHVQCHQCSCMHGRLHSPAGNRQAYRGQNTTFLNG